MSSTRYKSIPQTESRVQSLSDENLQPMEPGAAASGSFIRAAVALILVLTLFDVICLLYLAISPSAISQGTAVKPMEDIPFLSTYARLDRIYSGEAFGKSAPRPPIINVPRALTYVDSSRPNYVQKLWPNRYVTTAGVVPFDEWRVIVTETVSTVAEYHAMDFGMENCTVALTIPAIKSTPGGNTTLDVWLLDAERKIDFTQLSWISKPTRKLRVGSFVPFPNSTQQTKGYYCKTGSKQIIELSCGTADCSVHVPASGHDAIGLYIQQYQTV